MGFALEILNSMKQNQLLSYFPLKSIVFASSHAMLKHNLTSLRKLQYTSARTNVTHASIVVHAT